MSTRDGKRVKFDFEVDFSNGGGIQGQDFRLDVHGDEISDEALAEYIVQDMRLLMVGETRILNKEIIEEQHKRAITKENDHPRRKIVDVSHAVEDGMVTYEGLPAPIVCDYLSREQSREQYADGTEFQIGKIELVANTGTYVDSPFHRFEGGKDLSELPLSSLADLDTVILRFDASQARAIGRSHFEELGDLEGKAILVHTGWDTHWRTDRYFEGHPFLTGEAAEYLVDAGASLVGIDSLNIDDTEDLCRPVHTALLNADIPIAEHLRGLEQLPERGAKFSAVPVKVKGFGTFPVRAFAVLEER